MAADVLRDVVAFLGLAILAVGLGLLAKWLGVSVLGGGLIYFALVWMDGRKETPKPRRQSQYEPPDRGAEPWI